MPHVQVTSRVVNVLVPPEPISYSSVSSILRMTRKLSAHSGDLLCGETDSLRPLVDRLPRGSNSSGGFVDCFEQPAQKKNTLRGLAYLEGIERFARSHRAHDGLDFVEQRGFHLKVCGDFAHGDCSDVAPCGDDAAPPVRLQARTAHSAREKGPR